MSVDGRAVEMDSTALAMMLDGIDVSRVRRPALWSPSRGSRKEGIDKTISL
jgi:hypothetical protein